MDRALIRLAGIALIPDLGYAAAAQLTKGALATNANVADLVVALGLVTPEKVTASLAPERLTEN